MRMGKNIKVAVIIAIMWITSGCSADMESTILVDLITAFDFENGSQGWEGGVSDYPDDYTDSTDFIFGYRPIPSNLLVEGNGLEISAENPHGDLFYFFKKHVTGLRPNKKYKLDFEFLVYTQLNDPSIKSLKEELYLKMGAVNYAPQLEETVLKSSLEYKMLNVDKGEKNNEGGQDIVNIGSIKEFTKVRPETISGNTFDFNIEVVSNNDGDIWLLIGVDSGVKSNLTFGMTALTVYFTE